MSFSLARTLCALFFILISFESLAQTYSVEAANLYSEQYKRVNAAKTTGVIDEASFGEQIDYYNGGLSFAVTDISIPGNNNLPVEVRRTYSVRNTNKFEALDFPMADWDLDIPHLSLVTALSWPHAAGINRCSVTNIADAVPPLQTYFDPTNDPLVTGRYLLKASGHWQGLYANMPGGGEMLLTNSANSKPVQGGPYFWNTKSQTFFSCLPSLVNVTNGGEGFLAITPDGTKYWFDYAATFTQPYIDINSYRAMRRTRIALYATRVEDRFGNWVKYEYGNAVNYPIKLLKVSASDGRSLDFTYIKNQVATNQREYISTVTDGARTWRYEYTRFDTYLPSLSKVTLPDSSEWVMNFVGTNGLSRAKVLYDYYSDSTKESHSCTNPGLLKAADYYGSIKHPSGATASYVVSPTRFGRSNVAKNCYRTAGFIKNQDYNYTPPATNWVNYEADANPVHYDVLALKSRTLSGLGAQNLTSTFSYSRDKSGYVAGAPCLNDLCAGRNFTAINQSNGTWHKFIFGNSYEYDEGKLLSSQTGTGAATLKTTANTYQFDDAGQPYPASAGTSPRRAEVSAYDSERHRPLKSASTVLDGVTFTNAINNFDQFLLPLSITASSSLGYSSTENITYEHNLSKWVIGNVKSRTNTNTNTLLGQSSYDPTTLLPIEQYGFGGQLQNIFSYWPDGSLRTTTDARGNVTWIGDYHRGIPRLIGFADGTTQSATVNNLGEITSTTDQLGSATNYQYDAMGRLAVITPPSEANLAYHHTGFSFRPVVSGDWLPPGVSVGQWHRLESTGNYRKITYFDAMWRPVLVHEYEEGTNATTLRQTIMRYDAEGRLVFTSYPRNPNVDGWLNIADTSIKGVRTSYDALGRVTKVEQDSELGVLATTTEYKDGFQTWVTNPRGVRTRIGYQVFDTPDTSRPAWIAVAEGTADAKITEMGRDVFGRTMYLRVRNEDSSLTQHRSYIYDSFGRLCKKLEPETQATLYDYDAAGNLVWSADGQTGVWDLNCQRASIPATAKTTRTYDSMNRLTALDAPNGTDGDKNYFYDADGALNRIQTFSNGAEINNRYTYNKRRLLISESSEQVGWYTWPISYGYDANANLNRVTYPSGIYVDYVPNALGQATQAASPHGTWATNISYYPNGAVKQFTYGNGVVHTMTQNARQLPASMSDAKPNAAAVISHTVTYDANTNVVNYNDPGQNGSMNRAMKYDGLDRLTEAYAPNQWGVANYQYDVFDNLKRSTLGLAGFTYFYDASNRVQKIDRDGGGSYLYSHNAKGEVLNDGRNSYGWDAMGRVNAITDPATGALKERYKYDGENRRVQASIPAVAGRSGSISSVYGKSGQLFFQYNGRENQYYEYIYLNDDLLATRNLNNSTGALTKTRYQHTDILGSPVATTDEAGNVADRTEYTPFGNPINRAVNGMGYTGHVMDSATGLTYMQQRYYDPLVGRFLSTDPVGPESDPLNHFGRYHYAYNNPYRFTDPDGRAPNDGERADFIGRGFAAANDEHRARNAKDPKVRYTAALAAAYYYREVGLSEKARKILDQEISSRPRISRDPKTIRYLQDDISSKFNDGGSVRQMIDDLKSGRLKPEDITPIRVFIDRDGNLTTLDHRRLYAHLQAGIPIQTVNANQTEIHHEAPKKRSTKNNGESVTVRAGKRKR
jgi:RHS repeat-associated protein